MWSGGISNPLSVIEQLTYLLFIKRLDELHTRDEHRVARTGQPIDKPLFTAGQDALRWSRFKELAPERMFKTVRDRVFPFIKSLGQTGDSDEGSTYTHHMKDALFMMPPPRVLANVVDQLDDIDMADRDTKGDHLRVHARQDRDRRAERTVPHATLHHQADGGHDRTHPEGRHLRPRLRHGRLPRRGLRASRRAPRRRHVQRTPGPAAGSTRAPSTATTSTPPCSASAA